MKESKNLIFYQNFSQAAIERPHILDSRKCTLVLRCTGSIYTQIERAMTLLSLSSNQNRLRRQVASIYALNYLKDWSDYQMSKFCFVKNLSDKLCAFCLIQTDLLTESLMAVTGYFYATPPDLINTVWQSLMKGFSALIHSKAGQTAIYPVLLCRKPMGSLLIKYSMGSEKSLLSSFASSYLHHRRYNWFKDSQKPLRALVHECFGMLYECRLEENYVQISDDIGSVTFFKEMMIGSEPINVQYALLVTKNNNLVTEVWVEPYLVADKEQLIAHAFDKIASKIIKKDSYELSRYFIYSYLDFSPSIIFKPI